MTAVSRMSPEERLAINEDAGWEAIKVIRATKSLPNSAAAFHRKIAQALNDNGFYVETEYSTQNQGDRRNGRVDIFAALRGGHVVIELDAHKPRLRSIEKLLLFESAFRLIVLRGVDWEEKVEGVEIVGVPVRQASAAEKANRKPWRKW